MSKTTESLVEDIYNLVSTKEAPKGVDLEAAIEAFGENIKDLMRKEFSRDKTEDKRTLRMSNIGRKDRYLWNVVNNNDVKEELQPHTYIKFMYGHVVEELLLFLTKAAGHKVTDEQKRVEVNGVSGSMDCKIDGVLTDVKSTSSFGFKKFRDGSLAYDDPFGYIGQIKGYAHAEGVSEYGWLAIDKSNGHITYLKYDEKDTNNFYKDVLQYDVGERIDHIKSVVASEKPPEKCHEDVPDGKSGNRKLHVECSYCPFKTICWPNLRAFSYSKGPVFLTEVVKEPNVPEIPLQEVT